MTLKDALAKLKALADPAVRKHNLKYGAGENQFGVKHGDLRTLAKGIKADPKLADALWATGNADAQLLSVLLTGPKDLDAKRLDARVRSVAFSHVADWLLNYVVKKHAEKEELRKAWMTDADRWAARAGWGLTAERVAKGPEGLDATALLDRIEAEMGGADPVVQWTMNAVLAEIGIHVPRLRKRAVAIGEKLGVYRDYPVSKGCTSPFAPIWIAAMVARKA